MTASNSSFSAGVYVATGNWYFFPLDRAVSGVLVLSEPVLVRPDSAPLSVLGSTLLQVLALSRNGTPHPDWSKLPRSPLLVAARKRSWGGFAKSAKHLDVLLREAELIIVPTRHTRGAVFEFLEASRFIVGAGVTPEEIGLVLRQALGACR